MRPKPDDALLALGLPRAWSYEPVFPRFDTHLASWSIFAIDHRAGDYYTRAALSMTLVDIQRQGLIGHLQTSTPLSKHLLLTARFRFTRKGVRHVVKALQDRYQDKDD